MQRLNRDMLDRYDIPRRAPAAVNAVQFGTGEALLGVVDRLIDEAGAGIGIACVAPSAPWRGEGSDPAALLTEQDGMYTLLARGYRDEAPVKREEVIQVIARVVRDDGLDALAEEPALALGLLDTGSEAFDGELRQTARLLAARHEAGLGGLCVICLGDDAECAARAQDAVAALAGEAGAGDGFGAWLQEACAFCPALAEGFARRADAREAAKQCAEMNYADGMLHLAEPFARLTVQASPALRARLPLDGTDGIILVDDLSPALDKKRRLFDALLFAMAAPGWLLGCSTLSECMKHDRLRAFVGRACYDELLPADPARRAADAPYVIECFERFENPLSRNGILDCARPLLSRFARGALPVMRDWANERFEPPRHLSFALAATIMLYAGARPDDRGRYAVARGSQAEALDDDPRALAVFATLSHDMPPEALAYAALADRELWGGADLRDIDGLEQRVALDIAAMQRAPHWLPEEN